MIGELLCDMSESELGDDWQLKKRKPNKRDKAIKRYNKFRNRWSESGYKIPDVKLPEFFEILKQMKEDSHTKYYYCTKCDMYATNVSGGYYHRPKNRELITSILTKRESKIKTPEARKEHLIMQFDHLGLRDPNTQLTFLSQFADDAKVTCTNGKQWFIDQSTAPTLNKELPTIIAVDTLLEKRCITEILDQMPEPETYPISHKCLINQNEKCCINCTPLITRARKEKEQYRTFANTAFNVVNRVCQNLVNYVPSTIKNDVKYGLERDLEIAAKEIAECGDIVRYMLRQLKSNVAHSSVDIDRYS